MTFPANVPETEARQPLPIAHLLARVICVLAAVAAAGGLFIPGLYRDSLWLVRAMRGQDLYTLAVALPALAVTLVAGRRGSVRAALVLVGLLGYMLYTYIGGAFAFAFNEFFLIYVALFALSVAALVALISSIDVVALKRRFDEGVPRRAVAIYLAVMGILLALMELSQIIPFITSGKLPEPLVLSGGTTFFIYALDLGAVLPLLLLSAIWLWRRQPWGYLLSACMLIKCATMGMALLATNAYGWAVGGTTDAAELLFGYCLIGFGGLGFSIWFFRHCRG